MKYQERIKISPLNTPKEKSDIINADVEGWLDPPLTGSQVQSSLDDWIPLGPLTLGSLDPSLEGWTPFPIDVLVLNHFSWYGYMCAASVKAALAIATTLLAPVLQSRKP